MILIILLLVIILLIVFSTSRNTSGGRQATPGGEQANTVKPMTIVFVVLAFIVPLWPISIPLFLYLAYNSYKSGAEPSAVPAKSENVSVKPIPADPGPVETVPAEPAPGKIVPAAPKQNRRAAREMGDFLAPVSFFWRLPIALLVLVASFVLAHLATVGLLAGVVSPTFMSDEWQYLTYEDPRSYLSPFEGGYEFTAERFILDLAPFVSVLIIGVWIRNIAGETTLATLWEFPIALIVIVTAFSIGHAVTVALLRNILSTTTMPGAWDYLLLNDPRSYLAPFQNGYSLPTEFTEQLVVDFAPFAVVLISGSITRAVLRRFSS